MNPKTLMLVAGLAFGPALFSTGANAGQYVYGADPYLDDAVTRMNSMADVLSSDLDYELTGVLGLGKIVTGGDFPVFEVSLEANTQYLLTMTCDKDCARGEINVFDRNGKRLTQGKATRDGAFTHYRPSRKGSYLVQVAIPDCRASRCSYVAGIFSPMATVDTGTLHSALMEHSVILVDARPANQFQEGHLPTAVNIPAGANRVDTSLLPEDTNSPIVVYCVNPKCGLRKQVAEKLKKQGYTNILMYHEGIEGWGRAGLMLVQGDLSTREMAKLLELNTEQKITLIDARPSEEYTKEHIPGAVSVPYDQAAKLFNTASRSSRDQPLVFYCHHERCAMRLIVAEAAWKAGYRNLYLYSAGMDGWHRGKGVVEVGLNTGRQTDNTIGEVAAKMSNSGIIGTETLVRTIEGNRDNYLLIDVREREDYAKGHIPTAQSLPFAEILKGLVNPGKDAAQLLIFYCWHEECGLSTSAADHARRVGYRNVVVYARGVKGWQQDGRELDTSGAKRPAVEVGQPSASIGSRKDSIIRPATGHSSF